MIFVRVLQKGQELFAASTGRAMRTLSKDIQMATSALLLHLKIHSICSDRTCCRTIPHSIKRTR